MILFGKKAPKIKKDKAGSVTVIIAAAGSGTRLGGVSKPLIKLLGRTAVEYSLDAFSALPRVARIIISTKEEDIPVYEGIVKEGNYNKVCAVLAGGKTRQESVSIAFKASMGFGSSDFVAIHDGARPLIAPEDITKAFDDAALYGSAVCAERCADTVQRADRSGFVSETVDREGLYLIKTPQVFSTELFAASVAAAEKSGFEGTDDGSLLLNAGFKVHLCETSFENCKLTYPGDIAKAELVLMAREREKEKQEKTE